MKCIAFKVVHVSSDLYHICVVREKQMIRKKTIRIQSYQGQGRGAEHTSNDTS